MTIIVLIFYEYYILFFITIFFSFYSDLTKSVYSFDEFEALWAQVGEQLEKEASSPSPLRKVATTTPVIKCK